MTKRERVQAAIEHRKPDRVPKGELLISPTLVERVVGVSTGPWEALREFIDRINADLVVVPPEVPPPVASGLQHMGEDLFMDHWGRTFTRWHDCSYYHGEAFKLERGIATLQLPELDDYTTGQVEYFAGNTGLFVFGLVDGGFQLATSLMGFEPFLMACLNNTEKIAALIERLEDFQVEVALKMVKAGAHGIIIADDFAYARNTLVSPQVLQFTLFPALKKAVQALHQAGVPVFLHCDGNITKVLPDLVATGIDGLQCLESAAGMDLQAIKAQWGDKLCLMGNLDISLLEPGADEASLRETVRQAVQAAAPGGGYIFSTSAGLTRDTGWSKLQMAYRLAEELGEYKI